jgi:UDP-N-acetylglucosamine acyltransferase
MIHSLTNISPKARIAEGVTIEAFTTVNADVEIGEGSWIGPNVTIMDGARIGKNCKVFPGAVISAIPQDLKYRGEETNVIIGDNVVVRECVTINKGTAAKGQTMIGNNCLLMAYVHIAHDCEIGNNVILVNSVGLAGEITVGDFAYIGGMVGVHQFVRIGAHTMIQGGSLVGKDVPPFVTAGRYPVQYTGLNVIGLKRRGFDNERIEKIHEIYRMIYNSGLNTSQAIDEIEKTAEPSADRDEIMNFIRDSQRGIVKGYLEE